MIRTTCAIQPPAKHWNHSMIQTTRIGTLHFDAPSTSPATSSTHPTWHPVLMPTNINGNSFKTAHKNSLLATIFLKKFWSLILIQIEKKWQKCEFPVEFVFEISENCNFFPRNSSSNNPIFIWKIESFPVSKYHIFYLLRRVPLSIRVAVDHLLLGQFYAMMTAQWSAKIWMQHVANWTQLKSYRWLGVKIQIITMR